MDDIRLPMLHGTMDDISQEEGVASQADSSTTEACDSMSSQGQRAIFEREAQISLNYARLDDDYKDVSAKVEDNNQE